MSWRGIKILKNRIHNQKNERVSRRDQKKKRRIILGLIKPDFKNILTILNIILAYNIKTWKYTTHKCNDDFSQNGHTYPVQFSRSVVSDSLQPHGLQLARPPCPSPIPGVYPNFCPLSQWCHPTTSSSVVPFSPHLQSFPASGSFPMSQFYASGGQSIGVSASTSVLPMNTQDWFPLGCTGWIFLQSKGLSRVFFNTTVQKHQFFGAQLSPTLTSIHAYWKNHSFD